MYINIHDAFYTQGAFIIKYNSEAGNNKKLFFLAGSTKERDEWINAISSARFADKLDQYNYLININQNALIIVNTYSLLFL